MEQTDRNKLMREIVERSNATTWHEARLEWVIEAIYHQTEPDTCLCGHSPIVELCVLRNRLNENQVTVGNVCVKKFMDLPSDLIFQAVRRISKDISSTLNRPALAHARTQGWINSWEEEFYSNTMSKRVLSEKQALKRRQINQVVMTRINRNRKC